MSQLTRRTVLAAGVGLSASAGLAAVLQHRTRGVGYVTPTEFGAIAGDPRAADANVRAFNAMGERALASGLEMVIPDGIWFLRADGSPGSGWNLRPAPGQQCAIRGEGPLSLIRRAPTRAASKFATMVRLWVTGGGESFALEGFAIDGNEQAFPFDATDPWAYQQSHCIELVSHSATRAAAALTVRDLSLSGVVADGIKVGAQCERFEALRVSASGRRRRHRSDIQFSRLPTLAVVSDCEVDAFESEPSHMVEGARMELHNVTARAAFDLAGPEDDPAGRFRISANNCHGGMQRMAGTPVTSTSFFRLQGAFVNCAFATAPAKRVTHANVIRASTLRFDACEISIGSALVDSRQSAGLFAHFEHPLDSVTFADCRFAPQQGVVHGAYVGVWGNSPSSLLRLENCTTERPLDEVARLVGPARVQLSGGSLLARQALVSVGARAAGKSRLNFERDRDWRAPRRIVSEGR